MKRWILGLAVALSILVPTLPAHAQYAKPYGTHGVRVLGIPLIEGYRYPVGGAAAGYGYSYGYAPAAGYGYAPAAGYGYAPAAGYGFAAPMMAPAGGCTGLSGGYSGFASPGFASPGFGYASPSFGYGAPQAGFLSTGLSILEIVREAKKIREELGGGGVASDADFKALQKDVEDLKKKYASIPDDTKASIADLNKRLSDFPKSAIDKLEQLDTQIKTMKNVDLQKLNERIDDIYKKNPGLKKD